MQSSIVEQRVFSNDMPRLIEEMKSARLINYDFYIKKYKSNKSQEEINLEFMFYSAVNGRSYSEEFDSIGYLLSNPDIAAAGVSPGAHHFYYGKDEGRIVYDKFRNFSYFSTGNVIDIDVKTGVLPANKIAVHLHIYYEDFIDKFYSIIKNVPFDVDVIVTSPFQNIIEKSQIFEKISHVKKFIPIKCKNIGRNFAPMLVELPNILKDYDLVCHLHSKKSLYTGKEQTEWADYLLFSLLADTEIVKQHLQVFADNPDIGMIAPVPFYRVPFWGNHWLKNEHVSKLLFGRLKADFRGGFVSYPVGGMFWFRPNAISKLLNQNWKYDDFPEELGQTDGTIHHALERALPNIVSLCGKNIAYYEPWSNHYARDRYDEIAIYKRGQKTDLLAISTHCKIVSFDVFDTLLQRSSMDKEIGKRAVAKYLSEMGHGIEEEQFVLTRNNCELELRKSINFEGDVSIYDVYDHLCAHLKLDASMSTLLVNKEFSADLNDQVPRLVMVSVVNDLWNRLRKKIIFVSDTYYSATQIHHMIRAAGITAEYELYVSSEVKDRKDTGRIWKTVLYDLEVYPADVLHIGDNVVSDVQIPAELGINSYLVINGIDKLQHMLGLDTDVENLVLHEADWRLALFALGSNPFFSA